MIKPNQMQLKLRSAELENQQKYNSSRKYNIKHRHKTERQNTRNSNKKHTLMQNNNTTRILPPIEFIKCKGSDQL